MLISLRVKGSGGSLDAGLARTVLKTSGPNREPDGRYSSSLIAAVNFRWCQIMSLEVNEMKFILVSLDSAPSRAVMRPGAVENRSHGIHDLLRWLGCALLVRPHGHMEKAESPPLPKSPPFFVTCANQVSPSPQRTITIPD